MAITQIPPNEFSRWLRPVSVLALFEEINFHKAAGAILQALTDGTVKSAAETLLFEGRSTHRASVPESFWQGWADDLNPGFWVTGDFDRSIPLLDRPGYGPVNLLGVRFERSGIERVVLELGITPDETRTTRSGGRPAGSHGEPIVRVTKRLLALPAGTLAGYKVDALPAELRDEYRSLGLSPPHHDNARRDARGILRALREGSST